MPRIDAVERSVRSRRITVLILLSLMLGGSATAEEEHTTTGERAPDAIDWWTVDGGGGAAVGGDWRIDGVAGQPDAGSIAGGSYVLDGGFAVTLTPAGPLVFADGFESGDTDAWSATTP